LTSGVLQKANQFGPGSKMSGRSAGIAGHWPEKAPYAGAGGESATDQPEEFAPLLVRVWLLSGARAPK